MVDAFTRELEGMDEGSPTLAASLRVLAAAMDAPGSPTSKSNVGKTLLDTYNRLRDLAPPAKEKDALDDLSARRAARRSAKA